jgi:energy-coupling factor transport system permease protein
MKLDPRVKLIAVCLLTTLAVIRTDLLHLIATILVCLLLTGLVRYPVFRSLVKMKHLLLTFALIFLLQAIFNRQGPPLLTAGRWTLLTATGLDLALQFLLRMFIIILAAGILSTSNARDLIQGLIQLKVPYVVAFMVTLAIGYIPLLNKEIRDTILALNLRGVNLRKISLGKKITAFSTLFFPVIMQTMERAQDLSISLELRGFRLKKQRSSWIWLRMNSIDVLVLVISGLVFGLMLVC